MAIPVELTALARAGGCAAKYSAARLDELVGGLVTADVADLLGDDEDTVREHYARWVPERQARLTNILQEAFSDKPKPKLVELRRSG